MSATLKDISARIGLSVTQVSRALNDHSDVSADTKARVRQAAKDLNYQPNLSARKLASGHSGIVGLVLPPQDSTPRDNLFVLMVRGLSAEFSRSGRLFVLHAAEDGEDMVKVHRRLIDGGSLDGFLLIEPQLGDRRIDYLRQRGVPFVVHGRTEAAPDYPYFDLDNFAVGQDLTRMLIDRGHRRIGFLNGLAEMSYVARRREGYIAALQEAGIDFDPGLYASGPMTEAFGAKSGFRMMTEGGPRPTAFVTGNMLLAKGLYGTLSMLGLRVPQDVSVVVHDDMLPGEDLLAIPPTSGTRAPLAESWAPMARSLIGAIDSRPLAELQQIGRHELVEAGSIAAPAG